VRRKKSLFYTTWKSSELSEEEKQKKARPFSLQGEKARMRGNQLPPHPSSTHRLPGDLSEREPPDPIPNSAVKTFSADDSVVFRHVKVGHRQAFYDETSVRISCRGFFIVHTFTLQSDQIM
jgi:hypothetical protein